MALPNVLSAMREIILDAPQIPLDSTERAQLYRKRFPQLSDIEHEDLVKIPPEKFTIYTVSIFQSEKGILENHLPLTFALLKRHWTEAFNERFIGYKVAQRLHRKRPWESQSPQVFVANFSEFINHDCPELLALRPDLGAIARLEATNYQLKRAPDVVLENPEYCIDIRDIRSLTVNELLQLTIEVAEPVRILSLPYDALTLREQFFATGKEAPEELAKEQETFLIGGRDLENALHWIAVPGNVQRAVTQLTISPATVEQFAGIILEDSPEAADESLALEYVASNLSRLAHERLIVLRQQNG